MAFQLLTILIRERPRAVAKAELHERLWPTTFVAESNLASLINEVRSAIDDTARGAGTCARYVAFGIAEA